ncbi:hypothetical protein EAI_12305 [Harpegnathos saltator]|uniref:Uncharacterized protein n=1 Tax=Harpegnathos saltator TaxID=610380 RepID=E2C848_HARSA|nr:hypothetical protein EAI_12305 [Harpegnathos saltator]
MCLSMFANPLANERRYADAGTSLSEGSEDDNRIRFRTTYSGRKSEPRNRRNTHDRPAHERWNETTSVVSDGLPFRIKWPTSYHVPEKRGDAQENVLSSCHARGDSVAPGRLAKALKTPGQRAQSSRRSDHVAFERTKILDGYLARESSQIYQGDGNVVPNSRGLCCVLDKHRTCNV